MEIKDEIKQILEERLISTEIFIVDVKSSPSKITVIIDHPKGVSIDDCVAISRFLHERLDESGLFDSHELEVGSPGMEEPLKILPQYKKRVGQQLSVLTFDGLKRTGKLVDVDSEGLELEEERIFREGKKKSILKNKNRILFTDIKESRVLISFDK